MKTTTKQVVETIGIFGVIASLIFVGIQLIQDRRVALGEQYASRAFARQSTLASYLESDATMSTHSKRWEENRPEWWVSSDPTLPKDPTPEDVTVAQFRAEITLMGWDNLFYQYNVGLLSEEDFQSRRSLMKYSLGRQPHLKAYMTDPRFNYTTSLDLFLEIAKELESD